jgi:murein DD-endopeptidase MepM/ murein hydrolase activator NlpD
LNLLKILLTGGLLCPPASLQAQVCPPLKKMTLTSAYGYRLHPLNGSYAFHRGIDLRARSDTVFAVLPGKASAVGYDRRLGIYIRLGHGEFESLYGHLSQIWILPGDTVIAGQPMGITGATGQVTGEHLHFGIRFKQHSINPLAFIYAFIDEQNKQLEKEK